MTARRQTSIKVDPVAWDEAKEIFKEYNLSVSDAINIFLNKVKLTRGLPFDINVPNEETMKAMQEARDGVGMYESTFEDLQIEMDTIRNAKT